MCHLIYLCYSPAETETTWLCTVDSAGVLCTHWATTRWSGRETSPPVLDTAFAVQGKKNSVILADYHSLPTKATCRRVPTCSFSHLINSVVKQSVRVSPGVMLREQGQYKQPHVAGKLDTERGEPKHVFDGALHIRIYNTWCDKIV